jgi:hypothetical protein
LPNSITNIAGDEVHDTVHSGVFSNHPQQLQFIHLPSTLTELPSAMFYNTSVYSIDLGAACTTIGAYAFAYSEINFCRMSNVTTIGDRAFWKAHFYNDELDIPASITTVGNRSFN